jgi:hypothetical protein
LISEEIVTSAFISIWIEENFEKVENIIKPIPDILDLPFKNNIQQNLTQ